MQKKEFLRIGPLTSFLMCLLLVGCGPSADEQASTPTVLTATADTEWTIPANFNTYTDENKTFSISYPSDWDVYISGIPELDIFSEEWIEGNYPELSSEGTITVFSVGIPCGIDCHHPSCYIIIGPTDGIKSITELDSDLSSLDGYKEYSDETTIIDGRESIITEYQFTMEVGERSMTIHSLMVSTFKGDTIWGVGCAFFPDIADYAVYEDDFQNIVRSLKLHY